MSCLADEGAMRRANRVLSREHVGNIARCNISVPRDCSIRPRGAAKGAQKGGMRLCADDGQPEDFDGDCDVLCSARVEVNTV